jgi:transposase
MALSQWLSGEGCTHIAMEATGIYWKPVWHVLDEGEFELVLANAAQVKNVRGRKTDVNDATWLADLGPEHFDRRGKATQTRRLVTRLHNLGYAIEIIPLTA